MALVASYKELDIWKLGMKLCVKIYTITEQLPEKEKYGLQSQMRRSASSIPANIAEGFGRRNKNEFRTFIRYAIGSLYELQTHLEICDQLNYLNNDFTQSQLLILEKMLNSFLKKLV